MTKQELRDKMYLELNQITGYNLKDDVLCGLNLGFPVVAFDTILQRRGKGKYDHTKSCKDNIALIHNTRAQELAISLLAKENQVDR